MFRPNTDTLAPITFPAPHLIRGKSSELISEKGAKHFISLVPQARFTDTAGAGHRVAADRNDVFGKAVLEFLGEAVPRHEL